LMIQGLVGEYLGRLYLTANGKPQSVVKWVAHRSPGIDEPGTAAARRANAETQTR